MNSGFYIEDANGQVEAVEAVEDVVVWGQWWATADRRVALTELGEKGDVSTVFLGIDYRYDGKGPPLLYETLVFGGPRDGVMLRYATREVALLGHEGVVAEIAAAGDDEEE